MKKIFALIMLLSIGWCAMAQSNRVNTNKNSVGFEFSIPFTYATDMGAMNDYLSSVPSLYALNYDHIKLLQVGFGINLEYFFANKFAYNIGLKSVMGKDYAAKDDLHTTSTDFMGFIGVEYYFYQRNKISLSANLNLGCDIITFDYGQYSGSWVNLTLPFGLTFWYKQYGFQLNYAPTLDKQDPESEWGLPNTALNNLIFTFRLKL